MKRDHCREFNEEVSRYRKTLLFYAGKCDWDTFKIISGRLFDYVESIELSEIERKFFNVFKLIMAAVLCIVIFVLKLDPRAYPECMRLKNFMILIAIAGCCYEFYFFLNFRMYMHLKTIFYRKRKECFISGIEQDFKEIAILPEPRLQERSRTIAENECPRPPFITQVIRKSRTERQNVQRRC